MITKHELRIIAEAVDVARQAATSKPELQAVDSLTERIADGLARTNPRFDRGAFMRACHAHEAAQQLVIEADYYRTTRAKCPGCALTVLPGQPCIMAQVSESRWRVLHEGCAILPGETGHTLRAELERDAREYHLKRKEP